MHSEIDVFGSPVSSCKRKYPGRIIHLHKLLSHSRQILQMGVGGMPHKMFLKSIELPGTKVLPQVCIGRSTGTTILSASRGTQTANEWDEIQHSIFTFAILEMMKQKKHASIWGLKEFVRRRVLEITHGEQKPTTRKEIKSVDWDVW